jgi:hypothetical protein
MAGLGKFGARKGKRHVTARVLIREESRRKPHGYGDEITIRGPSHRNILEQAARRAFGGELPYGCKLVNAKVRRLPGRTGGADAYVQCDVLSIRTTALRNPKRGRRTVGRWGGKKQKNG